MVYRVTRPVSLFSWVAGQDINFDGITTTDETFFGYDDWSPTATTTGVDPRQIGATGSLSAAGLVGGGKQFGGGGGKQFGAGGGQQFGAGGGKQFGGGGGKQFGAGGGKQFGAGGGLGDLTQTIANSFTRPPRSLTATEDASARLIHLSWTVPTFGQIGAYRIYRSSDGGHTFALLATVPGTQLTYQDTVTCNRTGYQYYVTAVLLNTTQESVPSNTVATIPPSTNPLTGCYTLSGFSSPASAVHGSLVPITWALTDDFYTTGNPVTNKAANTLVAIGPVPNGCTTGRTTILLNGSPQSGASTFPTPSGTGQFTFNWDTDGFCAGSYTFQLTLDSGQTQTTSALQLQIDVTDTDSTPHISITSLAGATVGVAYNNSITEDGGVGSLIWTVASGSLPSGISLGSSSGKLSGTPCDKPGNYTFTAQVTDSAGNSGTQTLTLNVLAAPVAQINQPLAPESAVPGAPGFAVSVNGTGFDACSAVQWNGSALTTVFKSATQLTTTIPSGDVLNPGTASISVAKTGSPTSNVDFFQITNPTATVYSSAAGVPTAVGHNPKGLISADLIGNGKLDLAVANYGSNSLSIVLGNGDGTFQSAVPYPVGRGPFSVITGDFDGNGKLDLAVANSGDNTVSILLGKGDGTFQSAVPYPVGNGPYSVSTGDFNGDGKLDLAVANQNDHTVSILLGNGDGTFQTHVDSPAGVTNVAGVAVGDFNGDSKLDLAVTNPSTDQVSILLGKGDGTFQTPVSYSTGAAGSNPIAVTAADFNGDGVLDLAVTNLNVETVAIFLGNGNGTFTLKGSYSTTIGNLTGPSAITTGDFDGDGKVDLAITDQSDNSVSILLGNGDGTFQSPLEFNTGNASNLTAGVAAGDFNGDGRLDVVVANSTDGTVSVMLQAPRVQLTPSPLPSFGTVAVSSTSSPPQVVTLTNTGSAALTMSSSGIAFGGTNPGDFSQNNTCPTSPSTLAAGSNCTINVTFAPTQAGARSASLNITDNAFDTPQNVSLSGTGVMAPPTNLTATATSGSGSVSLNWTASTSNTVASYNVYRSTVSGSGYSLIASVSTTSFTDTVTSGTYYYVVTAVDASSHESANSSEATATD
jgi:fibronectin type 3 domain-containing protein